MKKFVITGGAGFIGTNLVERLIEEGKQIKVVDDLSAGDHRDRLSPVVDFHQIDIRNTKELAEVFQGADVVVHLAALPKVQTSIDDPVLTHDVNVNGTLSVLEAARQARISRIVYAASSAVYGDQEELPLSINLPPQLKSPYALHKYMGEEMMSLWSRLYELETVSLRFFNVYGPHLDPEGNYALVIGKFLKQAREGLPLTITGDGEQTRDFIHVYDLVEAIFKASTFSTVGAGEVLNVGSGKQTSIKNLARLFSHQIQHIEPRLEPKHSLADISLTRELLGWEPKISVEEGVEELKSIFITKQN
jgi:UDP-glucose 4-epimerase